MKKDYTLKGLVDSVCLREVGKYGYTKKPAKFAEDVTRLARLIIVEEGKVIPEELDEKYVDNMVSFRTYYNKHIDLVNDDLELLQNKVIKLERYISNIEKLVGNKPMKVAS